MIRKVSIFWYVMIGIIFSQQGFADTPRLILDHLFVYKNQVVDYRISVQGEIPLKEETKGFIPFWNKGGEEVLAAAKVLTGTGNVRIRGRGSLDSGAKFKIKKFNYDSSMMVTINGKTHNIKKAEEMGTDVRVNLELQENWNGKFNWDIETSDPEADSHRLSMLKRIIPQKIPDSPHTGYTIEYDYNYPGNSIYEYVTSNAMGTFRWRYILSSSYSKEYKEEVNTVDQEQYDNDRQKPKDYPVPKGKLGPPLDQIKWDFVDD